MKYRKYQQCRNRADFISPRGFKRPKRQKKRKYFLHHGRSMLWTRFLPAVACLALLVYGGIKLVVYRTNSHATQTANETLQQMYESVQTALPSAYIEPPAVTQTAAPSLPPVPTPQPTLCAEYQQTGQAALPELQKLYAQNSDLVGWVQIPGVVNLPVVYRDNSYYLTHDFYGKQSDAGTLFLDENHPFAAKTQSLVIHGHDMYDGSMFGLLPHYRKTSYIREHGIVYFSTLFQKEKYVVIAVVITPEDIAADGYVAYAGTPVFATEEQFDDYIKKVQNASLYDIPIEVTPADALLTLSTCLGNDRLIVVCRRFRADETTADLLVALSKTTRR